MTRRTHKKRERALHVFGSEDHATLFALRKISSEMWAFDTTIPEYYHVVQNGVFVGLAVNLRWIRVCRITDGHRLMLQDLPEGTLLGEAVALAEQLIAEWSR